MFQKSTEGKKQSHLETLFVFSTCFKTLPEISRKHSQERMGNM